MVMKKPKYAALGLHQIINAGLNGFAAELLAESYADDPAKFGDETTLLMARAHNQTPVYMLISTQPPDLNQFMGGQTPKIITEETPQ